MPRAIKAAFRAGSTPASGLGGMGTAVVEAAAVGAAAVEAAAVDKADFGSAPPAREGLGAKRGVLLTRADRDHLGVHGYESPALALRKKRLGPGTTNNSIFAQVRLTLRHLLLELA